MAVCVAAAGLVTSSGGAATAGTTFRHLTAAQALKALPTSAQVGVKVSKKAALYKIVTEFPCNKKFPLVDLPTAAAVYSDGKVSLAQPIATTWSVAVTVFPSRAAAAAARVKLVALALQNCQRTSGGNAPSQITVLAADTAEGGMWKGARSTMVGRSAYGGRPYNDRQLCTWFQRGNVLLQVVETGVALRPDNGPRQEQARRVVTMAAVANLDRAAA